MSKPEEHMGNTLSQEMIDKYLSGELSHEESHRVEKIMLESDFDQEAMDGFEETFPTGGIDEDLAVLEKKIDQRTTPNKKVIPLWFKIAAGLSVLAISTFLILNINLDNLNNDELAKTATSPEAPTAEENTSGSDELSNEKSDIRNDSLLALNNTEEIEAELDVDENSRPVIEDGITTIDDLKTKQSESSASGVNVNGNLANAPVQIVEEELAEEPFDRGIAEVREDNSDGYLSNSIKISDKNSVELSSKKLEGVVKTKEGENLAGINVQVKGTDIGAVTDVNGNFSLDVPGEYDTVVVSSIGLATQEVEVRSTGNLEVFMEEDALAISEIVIAQKKESKTALDAEADDIDIVLSETASSNYYVKKESERSKKTKRALRRQGFKGTRIIAGNVLSSEDSVVLPGVNILVEGTTTYAETDENGNFKVEIPNDPKTTLALAFIGRENEEIEVGNETSLKVFLAPDTTKQSDLVVVDYKANREALSQLLTRARPAGGKKELDAYIAQNMQTSSDSDGKDGVIIEFTVLPTGELTDFNVVKGIDAEHDSEAQRLIKEGPEWVPATRNGKPQKDKVRVRIKFDK